MPKAAVFERIARQSRATPIPPANRRGAFAIIMAEDFPALGLACGNHLALLLELIRVAKTGWVRQRDGWARLQFETLVRLGLGNRFTRATAVRRAIALGWIEVRRSKGPESQYERLLPNWAKGPTPKAGVVDLAAARKRKAAR